MKAAEVLGEPMFRPNGLNPQAIVMTDGVTEVEA